MFDSSPLSPIGRAVINIYAPDIYDHSLSFFFLTAFLFDQPVFLIVELLLSDIYRPARFQKCSLIGNTNK